MSKEVQKPEEDDYANFDCGHDNNGIPFDENDNWGKEEPEESET
ncbi:hypothetical protein VCHA38O209_50259 [Vibrio chagasii]|nr:hypothetical protein VCHA38O209_50259 [Vibrio chagasii]